MRYSLLIFCIGLMFSCKERPTTAQKEEPQDTLTRKELISEVKAMYYKDQKFRAIVQILDNNCLPDTGSEAAKPKIEKIKLVDWILLSQDQAKIDEHNTKELIRLTKKYGFPGILHLGHDVPIFLVFVHSDKAYWDEIRGLIEKEYDAGRISEFGKDYIFWHLDGRPRGKLPHPSYTINYRGPVEIFQGVLKADDN